MAKQTNTEKLSGLVASTKLADFSQEAVDVATNLFFDTVGCMLAGAGQPATRIVEEFVGEQGAGGKGTIIGRKLRASSYFAALVNGTSAAILDYDDSTWRMIGHPSGVVVPAVLALGEDLDVSGARALEAYMIGYEAIAMLCKGTAPALYLTGRHTTAALGIFGATAACAKLLGLDAKQVEMAFGIAASASGAVRASHGTMVKGIHSGSAAAEGMMCALLAKRGFISQPSVFEHVHGFFNASIKGDWKWEDIGDSWGNPWEFLHPVEGPGIKLFPSGTTSFPAGECALEIHARHKPAPDQIERIVWKTTPLSMNIARYAIPNDQNEAFYCTPWAIAAALVDGRLGLRQYDDDKLQEPGIRALCAKVKVEGHPDMKDAKSPDHVGGELTVYMKNGDTHTHLRKRPRAYPGAEPITREQLVGKFEENAARALSPAASKAAEAQLFDIRNLSSVKKLMDTLRP